MTGSTIVCQYCFSEQGCDHGTGPNPSSACACSLTGPNRCPECGCECPPWYWGLGFVGPGSIRSFFGVGGDDNPGFSAYPASKQQLVDAAREIFEGADEYMADIDWLSANLPDRTFRDQGEVLAALTSVVAWRGSDSSVLVSALPMTAIAVGTRLVVGPDQSVVLVGKDGRPLDSFGPGEHPISRESAPLAAGVSRAPAPGQKNLVISARPVFASTQKIQTPINHTGRTRSGQGVSIRGSVTYSIDSPAVFLSKMGNQLRELSVTQGGTEANRILGTVLDQALSSHELGELTGSSAILGDAVRSGAAQAGLHTWAVNFDSVAPLSASDQMTSIQEAQRRAMANMPPEMQARIAAQMAAAMSQAQASRGMSSAGPGPGAGPAAASSRAPVPSGTRPCPACHAPNPPEGKFCQTCGQPLGSKRSCSSCGKEAEPGVKFCGGCGSRLS